MSHYKELIPLTFQPAKIKSSARSLKLIVVEDKESEAGFLKIPYTIYDKDRNWIPPIDKEIRGVFDPEVNPFFRHGAANRWFAVDDSGEPVGRIAAFVNFKKMSEENHRIGGIGFFECINDQSVAHQLFDTAVEWLKDEFDVTAVDGPINFGENDKYWGLLIKGFIPPSHGMNYNPPYYQRLFESYGFAITFRQLTNCIDLKRPLPERFTRIADRCLKQPRFSFRPFRYKDKDRFIADFISVYNAAWASFKNFQPIDEDVIRNTLKEIRLIVEEDFIWFAYADNKPAGFLFAVPDVNEIIKYSGGRLNTWGKLKFIFYRYTKGFSRVRVVVMGIVPEFQQHGLESGLISLAYREGLKRPRYKHVELSWVGDFNHKMIAIHRAMGAVEEKQHATLRKVLDSI